MTHGQQPLSVWPTPRASEWKGVGQAYRLDRHYLDATVQDREQETGPLNPTWVEWLMGFPLGWTDLGVPDDQLVVWGWESDPADADDATNVPRIERGVEQRRQRLTALGNAVVPEIPERLGRWMLGLLESE